MGTCLIPNCRKNTPSSEPFCADHRDQPTWEQKYNAAVHNWRIESDAQEAHINELSLKLDSISTERDNLQTLLQAEVKAHEDDNFSFAQGYLSRDLEITKLVKRAKSAEDRLEQAELHSRLDAVLISDLRSRLEALSKQAEQLALMNESLYQQERDARSRLDAIRSVMSVPSEDLDDDVGKVVAVRDILAGVVERLTPK